MYIVYNITKPFVLDYSTLLCEIKTKLILKKLLVNRFRSNRCALFDIMLKFNDFDKLLSPDFVRLKCHKNKM